jgi:hypothetical protein
MVTLALKVGGGAFHDQGGDLGFVANDQDIHLSFLICNQGTYFSGKLPRASVLGRFAGIRLVRRTR